MLSFTHNPAATLDTCLAENPPAGPVFVLTDTNTSRCCLPLLSSSQWVSGATCINIPAGDGHKNLSTLSHIWSELTSHGATRASVLINVGGGMVTDIGAFAAATFKRGIRFINIPTTLLAAVDASTGGKTGINFHNLKNEIGVFAPAEQVIISPAFFATLPHEEVLSGYGEVLKHALLDSEPHLHRVLTFAMESATAESWASLVRESVAVKEKVVEADPTERGLRKSLNLGHTAAHAFETLAMERQSPVPHGVAVAWGLVTDLVLSRLHLGMPSEALYHVADFVRTCYPAPQFDCDDYPRLLEIMAHDKKNPTFSQINFTLLRAVGEVKLDCILKPADITGALDIMRDLLGV